MTESNDIPGRRSRLPAEPSTTHAGLWHDVFPPVLRPKKKVGEAALHLRQVCGCPIPEGYPRAFGERKELLSAQRGDIEVSVTWLYEAEVLGRMIVGLGAGSVLEHQVRLQHTWGVPEIPGSGLKGLASTTAHRYGSDSWKKSVEADGNVTATGLDHQSLFGDTTHGGLVIFHDAWWIPEGNGLPLDLDVMTVHQREYYRDPGKHPPSDTEEPTPVSFLTARGKYLVALTGPETWVRCAAEWLQLGLEREGIGAKTRAGYGRMKLARQVPSSVLADIAEFDALLNDQSKVAREKLEEIRANWADRIRALDPDQQKVIRQRMLRKFHVEKIIRHRDDVLALLGI